MVRALQREGISVRVLVRDAGTLNNEIAGAAVVWGDLRDREAVRAAVSGCSAVFHVAARYSLWGSPEEFHQVNVEGTRHVLQAALDEGVERVVHTSSVATVGRASRGRLADETWYPRPQDMPGWYHLSKWQAEELARGYVRKGLRVVIVNPTFPVGAGDVKPTRTGQVILDFLRGRLPAYVDTGMNVVDVDDVAQGHLLAWRKGVPGQRYILGHRNMTMRELLEALARVTGRRAPAVRMPLGVALALAYADDWLEGRLLRRVPHIPLEGVKTARHYAWVDCSKAVKELGLPQTPIEEALEKAVRWFRDAGYAKAA